MHGPFPHRTAVQADATAHVLHRDFETRSRVDLRKVGAHRYAADPSTEILCAAYAVDAGPVDLCVRAILLRRNSSRLRRTRLGS
jgi:hypothetical protein